MKIYGVFSKYFSMTEIRAACLGASNFKKSLNMAQVHTALKPYKGLILNLAISGAAVNEKNHKKSFFQQLKLLQPFQGRTIFILFIGQNKYERNFNKFLEHYKRSILDLEHQVGAGNLTVLLALPRGNTQEIITEQAKGIAEVGLELQNLGIHTLNVYNKLPDELKRVNTLFDKSKDCKHYSFSVLMYVQQLTAEAIKTQISK